MSKKINKARFFRNSILILLVLGIVGVYFSNRFVKSKGFDGLGDFITTYRTNSALAEGVVPGNIQLKISKEDYTFLSNKRQEALDRGIQINEGDSYVPCSIIQNKQSISGELRLKGHMTDHLEGDKWSFRVKSDEEVMGMYRFSLQNPATRNYAYEWVYHQLLAHEGIIHLKYDFIRLQLNDQDLGIYAIEEHFGQHILRDNERPKGAILRWNPELYWAQRIDELNQTYIDEGYSGYASSYPEAYDEGVVKKDPELVETYQKGAALLEAFRRGEQPVSAVFDVTKMARFHAVIDLVGGYHSLDWSDLKFYYNSETKRIEPVGYESFSVRETVKIAGQRTPDDYAQIGFNYHDKLFADPVFFKAYIQELERICNEAYFKSFAASIEKELNLKRGILAQEFAYIKFSFKPYYDNIELIRHNLALPKAFHAFLESKSDSTATISVTPVSDFPIEILELVNDGKDKFTIATPFILPPKARDTYAHYFTVNFNHNAKKLKNLFLRARIPGSQTIFDIAISDLPAYKGAIELENVPERIKNQDSTLVWLSDSIAVFRAKNMVINQPINIDKNQTLRIFAGQSVDFQQNGQLIIGGKLEFIGQSEREIQVTSKGEKKNRILVYNGELLAVNTVFSQLSADFIQINNGTANFQSCTIAESHGRFLTAVLAQITFTNCGSGRMESLGYFDRCLVRLKGFSGNHGQTFLTAFGSDIEMYGSSIKDYALFANLNYSANLSNWNSAFSGIGIVGELNNDSHLNSFAGTIRSSQKGYQLDLNSSDKFSSYLNQGMEVEIQQLEIVEKV